MSSDYDDGSEAGDGRGADDVFDLLPWTIEGVSSAADPSAQIVYLTAFCDALAFVEYTEELDRLPLDEIVPLLVRLAGTGRAPDVMLMSARVLTYLLDLMPRSVETLVNHGAVEAFCRPLMEIESLDVAEQCLEALEKLSRRQSEACLKAGVIKTVLSFMDFFELSMQRVALSTVNNVCEKIPEDCLSSVMDVVPTLCNLLDKSDRKLVESTALCLIKIVENFSHSSELLDGLCKHGVVKQSLILISPVTQMTLGETTYIGIIGLLVRFASHSLLATRTLYELNINNILGSILRNPDLSRCSPHSCREDVSRDKIFVALKLLNQLIPPVAYDEKDIQLVLGKEKIIIDEPKLSLQFAADILPALVQIVNSGANPHISYGCVSVLRNYILVVTPDMLRVLIKNANMPKLLVGLLYRKDHHVLIPALNIVDITMKKLPGEFLSSFVKEGVSHAIRELAKQEDYSQSQLIDEQSSYVEDTDDQTAADLSKCLCYAFDLCSHPSSSKSKTCMLQRHTLPLLAQRIMLNFFDESFIADTVSSENLGKLKACCEALENNVDSALTNCTEKEEYLSKILDEVATELNEGESMTTFEFIESGFVRFLANYLTNGNYHRRGLDGDKSDAYLTLLNRLQIGVFTLLSGQSWEYFPLTSLVRHLQNALSTLETFPVIMSSAYEPSSRSIDIPAKHSTNPCLQVHFVKEEEETALRHYDSVLTVEFSSSYDTIEGFLWPRVNKKTTAAKMTRATQRHRKQSSREVDSEEPVKTSTPQSNEGDIRPKLIFLLGGKQLDRSITLYQAILQDKIDQDPDITVSKNFWNELHTVTFSRAKEPEPRSPQVSIGTAQSSLSWDTIGQNVSFLSSMLLSELPCKLEKSNPWYDILFTLKILEGLNRSSLQLISYERSNAFAEGRLKDFDDLKVIAPALPQTEFISSKLTAKLEQQMHDRLAMSTATMPLWCTQLVLACPFLFSFEARWKYFCLDTFGVSENPMQNSEKITINDRRSMSASVTRRRFKVNRHNILCSAAKMMSWYASGKVLLEIEFNNEVGFGLGPTLEFYTLVSHEIQKVGMGMWRGDQTSSSDKLHAKASIEFSGPDFVLAPSGLFPRPWSEGTDSSNGVSFSMVLKNFFLLGQLIARAIQDRRILDLPFSSAFYKLILEQDLDIYDIQSFDPELGRTLIEFQALAKRRSFKSKFGECSKDTFDLAFRGTRLEDLCLDFALPGYPDYVFASRSNSQMVNISNLEEYVSIIIDATLRSGISRQLESFKSGFNKVFPIKALQFFTTEELEQILCGAQDTWDLYELKHHINFDHGYSSTSPHAIQFLEIILEFETQQRRAFLLFMTGTPRLPPGGLASLEPKLTIVYKHCNNDADMELPSVMTCANYLKLPPYSSKERMREKLVYAIMEGQGAFHLS